MKQLKIVMFLLSFNSFLCATSMSDLKYVIFPKEVPVQTFVKDDANKYCKDLILYGLNNWRLPAYKELAYLSTQEVYKGVKGSSGYANKELLDLLEKDAAPSFWVKEYDENVISFSYPPKDSKHLTLAKNKDKHKVVCVHPNEIPQDCYHFDKKNFDYDVGLVVDIRELEYPTKPDHWIYISFADKNISYSSGNFGFWCSEENKNEFQCSGDCDGGQMKLFIKEGKVSLNISHARLSDTPDDPVIHSVHSNDKTFAKGVKGSCLKPDTPALIINYDHKLEDSLLTAAAKGDIKGVKEALEKGVNVNTSAQDKDTALVLAIDYFEIVKLLVSSGANINQRVGYDNTALSYAVSRDKLKTVKYLIGKGADVTLKDEFSNTSLHDIASDGNIEIAKLLLDKGADINTRNYEGDTPAFIAVKNANLPMLKLFIQYNAQINIKTKHDQYLRSIACNHRWDEGCKLLSSLLVESESDEGLYVCYYDKEMYKKGDKSTYHYEGCGRSHNSCKSIDEKHFGKYPNNKKANEALNRCLNSTPKFVSE